MKKTVRKPLRKTHPCPFCKMQEMDSESAGIEGFVLGLNHNESGDKIIACKRHFEQGAIACVKLVARQLGLKPA